VERGGQRTDGSKSLGNTEMIILLIKTYFLAHVNNKRKKRHIF
jgi:hypothetical protein